MSTTRKLRIFVGQSSFSSYVRKWIKAGISPDDVVLDVGARDFPYTRDSSARDLYGVDIPSQDEPTLGWSDTLLSDIAQDKRLVPVVANCESLPFSTDSIDTIVCTEVLEHVRGDTRAIGEFARVLRPTGRLLLTTPNGAEVELENPHHHRHYRPDELRDLLRQRFESVELRTVFPNQRFYLRQYHATSLPRRLSWRLLYEIWWRTAGRNDPGGYSLLVTAKGPKPDGSSPIAHSVIVCAACKGTLDDGLRCTACGRSYGRESGVPVLLIPEQ